MVRYPHVQDLVVQDGWALMSPRGGSGRQEAMQQNEGRAGTRRGAVESGSLWQPHGCNKALIMKAKSS